MPYPVSASQAVSEAAATAITLSPGEHAAGDFMLVLVQQDVGTGTISLSGSFTEIGTQAAANGQRIAAFWKWAASSSEAAITVSSTLSDDLAAAVLIYRGVNATTPIDAQIRSNTPGSTSSFASGALTTTTSNCLVVHAFGADGGGTVLRPAHPHDLAFAVKVSSAGGHLYAGSKVQAAAGAAATATLLSSLSTESGTVLSIALRDDGTNSMAPELASSYTLVKHFSSFSAVHDATTWAAPNTIAATIDTLTVSSTAPTVSTSASATLVPDAGRINFMLLSSTEVTADAWVGGVTTISALNLSNKAITFRFAFDGLATSSQFGARGILLLLADGAGAWVALRVSFFAGLNSSSSESFQYVVHPDSETPVDSGGGTIDWTNITKFGFVHHRTGSSATNRGIMLRHFSVLSGCAIVGGSAAVPVSAQVAKSLLDGWIDDGLLTVQAGRQTRTNLSLQLGNGSVASYIDATGSALAFRQRALSQGERAHWRVANDEMSVAVKASASDVVKLAACVLTTDTRQTLVVDPASSPSAAYDFTGVVLVGWRVENNTSGIPINGAVFDSGYRITLNGGLLTGCQIARCKESPAVLTSDPDNIVDCAFVAGASGGHAVELTTPGTYTFAGNTFTGYGAGGTTDAAIYNNSGGAVTLNITGGGDTPTIRNGTGASTTVNSGATLTLTGLIAGSDIVILDAGTTTERVNVDANAGTTYDYSYTATGDVDIGVFKTGYVPLYVRGFTLTTSDATLPIAQAVDRGYLNP